MNTRAWNRTILLLLLLVSFGAVLSIAQQPSPEMTQQKLATMKQSAAANQAALRQYQWLHSPCT